MRIHFNTDKIVPSILEIAKVVVITLFYIYILKGAIFNLIPFLKTIPYPIPDLIFILIVWYIEELITITYKNNHVFGRNHHD